MTELVQEQFCKAVKAMSDRRQSRLYPYISADLAKTIPEYLALPEFWREPARVMANCGYYASADEWMKENVEGGQ